MAVYSLSTPPGPALLERKAAKLWDWGVHAVARVGYSLPFGDPQRYRVQLHRNIPYRPTGKRSHLLDVYRPWAPQSTPAVLYVHGGGFSALSKDTHRVMALSFAARGYTVFNINYRLGPRHRYPAPIEDAAAALEWVMDHAAEYGADPARIILAGESAGANLVMALAICCAEPRPELFARRLFERSPQLAAVLPSYGLLDMQDLERFNHPRLPRLVRMLICAAAGAYVGRPVRKYASLAPLASPLRILAAGAPPGSRPLPPTFAACGTADPLLIDSKRLQRVLRARGGVCELSVHPGEIHGFNVLVWRREAKAKWRAMFRFLERHVARPRTLLSA